MTSINNENSSTRLYSLEDGKLSKYIYKTNQNETFYLLYWLNKESKSHYIIEQSKKKITINDIFKDEI